MRKLFSTVQREYLKMFTEVENDFKSKLNCLKLIVFDCYPEEQYYKFPSIERHREPAPKPEAMKHNKILDSLR